MVLNLLYRYKVLFVKKGLFLITTQIVVLILVEMKSNEIVCFACALLQILYNKGNSMKKHIFTILSLTSALFGAGLQASQGCDGFYVGGFGGANFMQKQKHEDFRFKPKTGYVAGASVGYRFADIARVEAEFAYRNNSVDNGHGNKIKQRNETYSYMANAYYDLDLGCDFTPYIGGGVGYAQNRQRAGSSIAKGWEITKNTEGFAYQGIAGVSYDISSLCEKASVGLEYRYFATKQDIKDHSVAVALKRYF